MRLHVLSDLHEEFGAFEPPDVEVDVTVLAGDTYTKGRGLRPGTRFGRPVVMVAGNHEFYDGAVDTALPKLRAALVREFPEVTLLENEEAVIGGTRFLGCTLWSDFRLRAGDDLVGVKRDANACVGHRHGPRMMDFWNIRVARDGYRKFRPLDAATLHARSVAWLDERFAAPFDGPTAVVTHHAPSPRCLPAGWWDDPMSCAYASDMDALIERWRPAAWIWGHVHTSVPAFRIGETLMVSNPRGYTPWGLNPAFDPRLVMHLAQRRLCPGG